MSLRVWSGSNLIAEGFSGGSLDSSKFYEIQVDQYNSISLQEWEFSIDFTPPGWGPTGSSFPVTATNANLYTDEDAMLTRFNDQGYVPNYYELHDFVGVYNFSEADITYLTDDSSHTLSAGTYIVEETHNQMSGYSYEIIPVTMNIGSGKYEVDDTPTSLATNIVGGISEARSAFDSYTLMTDDENAISSDSSGPSISGPVYQLTTSDGVTQDGPYVIMGDGSTHAYKAYLADVNDDDTIGDVSSTADANFNVSETMTDLTSLTNPTPIGEYDGTTYTPSVSAPSGPVFTPVTHGDQTATTSADDKVQINVATSTGAFSGMIDAAEGLDSLHLDGLAFTTESVENLKLESSASMITSDIASGFFSEGKRYAEISLGDGLQGRVDVWTQTPEIFGGNDQFDHIIGIYDKANNTIIATDDDDDPVSGDYFLTEISDLITNSSSTRSDLDSYVTFTAELGDEYSVIVGDLNDTGYETSFGGVFELYAVENVGLNTEELFLSETLTGQTNGALIDFTRGETGFYQSAFVSSFGGNGSVGFTIDGFEYLGLTDYADYVVTTEHVGHRVGEDMHDALYFSTAQSGMIIDPGKSINGVDKLSVHSDSSIYLSYIDSTEMSGEGINVDIYNDTADVFGTDIDTFVEEYGNGTGLLIDYLETTIFDDTVINYGDVGMVVNLGGNWNSSGNDYFTGSSNSSAVDVLDARMANELEFSDDGSWIQVSGYNEIDEKEIGDNVYDLTTTDGVSVSGKYAVRYDVDDDAYYATPVGGDGAGTAFYYNGSEQLTTLSDLSGLTSIGSLPDPDAKAVNAKLQNVDMIMVRDDNIVGMTSSDYDQIWSTLYDADVDLYVDMSDIYGETAQQIDGLGAGTEDTFGNGYDVQTSAQVDDFGGLARRVYYDGDHRDFTDENDVIDTDTQGSWEMVDGDTTNGAGWAAQVSANTSGGGGSFYIVVGGKKIAVKHSDSAWIVDNSSLSIAQGVSMGTDTATDTIVTNYESDQEAFIAKVANRYGIELTDSSDYSFTNSIYLNATEQQIEEVLDGDGSLASEKAFNFGFYTKVVIGDTTVNLKIIQDETDPQQFTLDFDNIDLMVESFYNRVENAGESIDTGSAAGNFIKVDNENDISMGNGGDDTYVIAGSGGTALEYGNINIDLGGLSNSESDSINFANIDSIADLELARGTVKNETTDSSLLVNDAMAADPSIKTVIFDNFNEFLDFRRIEFLTIDDASSNEEIFEISVDGNIGIDDGANKDLKWDNEIVVANNTGDTIYADGGTDILVGGSGNDIFNLENVVSTTSHDTMSHVYIKNIGVGDSITMAAGDYSGNSDKNDGQITIESGGSSYMIFTDDEAALENYLAAATIV